MAGRMRKVKSMVGNAHRNNCPHAPYESPTQTAQREVYSLSHAKHIRGLPLRALSDSVLASY